MIMLRWPTIMRVARRQMSNISCRTAVKSDIPLLYQWSKTHYDGFVNLNEEVFCKEIDEAMSSPKPWHQTQICEATENGNTSQVGMVSFFRTYAPYCTPSSFEVGIYVAPEWRKKNISITVLQNLTQVYLDEEIERAYIIQLVSNTLGKKTSDRMGYKDLTASMGLHTMYIDLKEKTFYMQKCDTNIRVRPAKFEDCSSMCNLLQDPKSQNIGVMPISVTAEKLQKHGFSNTGRQYFEAIVAVDPTKSDAFGNELVVGCAVYNEGFLLFAGKVLNLTSVSANSESSDTNVAMLLLQELENISHARGCCKMLFAACENTSSFQYANEIGAYNYFAYFPVSRMHSLERVL